MLIGADARGMRTTIAARRGVVIFSDAIIRPRLSGSDIQHTNSTDPALGPPDIAPRIYSNQVRSQTSTTCWGISYFILLIRPPDWCIPQSMQQNPYSQ